MQNAFDSHLLEAPSQVYKGISKFEQLGSPILSTSTPPRALQWGQCGSCCILWGKLEGWRSPYGTGTFVPLPPGKVLTCAVGQLK